MPMIMPIRDLRKTSEISELAHKNNIVIFKIDKPEKKVYVVTVQYQGRNI